MIGVTTAGEQLLIVGDLAIPNAPGGQWTATRITALITAIEKHVAANEAADSVPRKPNFRSALVTDDAGNT